MSNEEIKCSNCPMRLAYDNNPKSLKGRFWKWHIKFCPGWKAYLNSLADDERAQVVAKYS